MENPRIRQSHIRYLWPIGRVKTIILIRDIRDSLVSNYDSFRKNQVIDITFSKFLRNEKYSSKYGLKNRIDFLNSWYKNSRNIDDVLFVKYEDLKKDLKTQIKKIISFSDINIEEKTIELIIEETSLFNMKKMEKRASKITEKINKGLVGRYKDYFNDSDMEFFRHQINKSLVYDYGYEY